MEKTHQKEKQDTQGILPNISHHSYPLRKKTKPYRRREEILPAPAVRIVRKVLLPLAAIMMGGIIYVLAVKEFGFGIPCVFRLITGYLCPGCGMTHALVCVLSGEFKAALSCNALSITVLPAVCLYLLYRRIREAVFEKDGFAAWEYAFLVLIFAVAIAYGIIRNL